MNYPPTIQNQTFEISEDTSEGDIVGTIVASDSENDVLKYEIVNINTNDFPFELNSINGVITVKSALSIDYEQVQSYLFEIVVTELNDETHFQSAQVRINILDINEIPQDGLIAYYPLNGDTKDKRNSFNGNLFGGAFTSDRRNNPNSSLEFDGIDDYLDLGSSVANGINSISLWFNLDYNVDASINKVVPLISRDGDYYNNNEFNLVFVPPGWEGTLGKLRFLFNENVGMYYYIQSDNSIWQSNTWHHIVINIDQNEGLSMFIDNIKQLDTNNFNIKIPNSLQKTYIGSFEPQANRFFKGKIDDIAFYNRSLTKKEITELFTFESN